MISFKSFIKKLKFIPGESFSALRSEQSSVMESDDSDLVSAHHPSAGVFSPKFHKEDRDAIKAYGNATPDHHNSSSSLGKYAGNRSRGKSDEFHDAPKLHFRARASEVHAATKKMEAVFRPENTNKKHLTSHSGLASQRVVKAYSSLKPGDRFVTQSVTSHSTTPTVAKGFARTHLFKVHKEEGGVGSIGEDDPRRHLHVLETKHEPNTCISPTSHKLTNPKAASLTNHEGEDEVTSRHGTHCTYHGKTVHTLSNPHSTLGPFRHGRDGELGVKSVTIHHITMHSLHTHEPVNIEKYPHPYVDHHIKYEDYATKEVRHPAYDEERGDHGVKAK